MAAAFSSEADRSALLDAEVERHIQVGYDFVPRTATAAQLIKPKAFGLGCVVPGFVFFFAGLLLYLLMHLAEGQTRRYLSVDETA